MGFSCGIVGLPNVGKTSLFNAISGAHAASSNYPFCTIEPNKATVAVPDATLAKLAEIVKSPRVTPTALDLVDVAGLVEGAHKGEGLGNQFLAHMRDIDLLIHLVRLFRGENVTRETPLDPIKDLRTVIDELRFKDLETIEGRLQKEKRRGHATKDAAEVALEHLKEKLSSHEVLKLESFGPDELAMAQELCLLSTKPYFVVGNLDEGDLSAPEKDARHQALAAHLAPHGVPLLAISSHIEEEIHGLDPEERTVFMEEYGLTTTGLERIIALGYKLLDLITFYTFNENELRAWTLKRGEHIITAAGKIHTDMAKGFIRADVVHADDFLTHGSFSHARTEGKMVTAGRDYIVRDRDIILIKFKA
jgi:ribosome-binding ATPase